MDRYQIIDYFGLGDSSSVAGKSYGEAIVESNKLLLSFGKKYGVQASPRTQSEFLYSPEIKKPWRNGNPYSDKIIGAIAYIKFGDFSQVYSDSYIEEFIAGEWDHWNTPRDYMGGKPGILLLYDTDREGITIQAEVIGVKKQGSGNFPYRNTIDTDSVIVFNPPIPKELIIKVHGLESFGRSQTPKYNLRQYIYDELMVNYTGELKSRIKNEATKNNNYTLLKRDDGIKIEGEGISADTSEAIVKTRLFQSAFRNSILELFDHKCLLYEVDIDFLLEAAHIKPFSKDISTAGDFANGLALCTLHHTLFDRGLISIKNGSVIPSKMLIRAQSDFLNEQYHKLSNISHVSLPKGDKSEKYLEWHYNKVFVK